ncbi:MAG: aminopeptidase P family protein [Clostridia bacterium]|nr:aminopeptidase P family protein [Clostridia bacterium]
MTRLEKIRRGMEEKGLDAIYITSSENHRYACGFNNPDGQVLITKERAFVFADFRYIEAARRESAAGFEVIMPEDALALDVLKKTVGENGVRRLGFEEYDLTYRLYSCIAKQSPDVEMVPASDVLSKIRITKTDEEVEKIIKAQRIAEAALDDLLGRIKYDMTEKEVAAELEYLMKRRGADGISFETIAVSGSNSSSPHGVPRDVKLERGFLTLDFGALIDGYHSDMTRTVVIGKATEDMKQLYSTVLSAQLAVLDVIKEGESNYQMDKIARDVIDATKYKGTFGHSLGHGVGLLIHELPNLSPKSPKDLTLKRGEVVTVEPGIYVEGAYGCRIEDMVLITPGGAQNLTKAPKEMIEI